MNTNGRWFRAVISGLIISIVTLVRLVGAAAYDDTVQLMSDLRAGRALPIERMVLSGVATVGKYRIASIREAKTGMASWFTEGEFVFGYTLKAIADNHVILVRRKDRSPAGGGSVAVGGLGGAPRSSRDSEEEFRVALSGTNAGPEPYSKAWINSRANPMLSGVSELPMLEEDWPTFTDAEKLQIIDFYKKHGWKLVRASDLGGTAEFVWRNIYEDERKAALKANHEKFEKALTPEQLVLWKEMRSFKFIPAVNGKHTDEQEALIASRQLILDQFKASLTPEQAAERAGLMDFTKANWK